MSTHHVLHDPEGLLTAKLPLDRGPYELLVKAVLGWTDPFALQPGDYEQIALQLTGHGWAVVAEVRYRVDELAHGDPTRALTEVVLREANGRLKEPYSGTMACVQNRARLVRALYERLDRLAPASAAEPADSLPILPHPTDTTVLPTHPVSARQAGPYEPRSTQ
ncbi:DUF6415 family natural product biosynthesis protein [Streptomyces sp. bgisy060]|uniref:DUF6415 family natural product biosynthesis protein n=1 Tax=Streptomyces sp. bgisy060 TaxID=3413775 RepID=UPI003EC085B5